MIARGLLQAGASVYVSSRKAKAGDAAAAELAALGRAVRCRPTCPTRQECLRLADEVGHTEDASTCWSTIPAPPGARPSRSSPPRPGTRRSTSTSRRRSTLAGRSCRCCEAAGTDDDPARVINVGSIDGLQAPTLPTYSYSASKAGLHQLTRVLARSRAPAHHRERRGARAVRVEDDGGDPGRVGDEIAGAAPLGRIGRPTTWPASWCT